MTRITPTAEFCSIFNVSTEFQSLLLVPLSALPSLLLLRPRSAASQILNPSALHRERGREREKKIEGEEKEAELRSSFLAAQSAQSAHNLPPVLPSCLPCCPIGTQPVCPRGPQSDQLQRTNLDRGVVTQPEKKEMTSATKKERR